MWWVYRYVCCYMWWLDTVWTSAVCTLGGLSIWTWKKREAADNLLRVSSSIRWWFLYEFSLLLFVYYLFSSSSFFSFSLSWASSVDEEAGRDAAARSERGRLNGETRKNSESSVTDSSDIKNPDDVSKNHRSLAKTKEDQRREAEKRRSIQEAIRGNTGQVYGFDSRRVSPLLRVYFFGEWRNEWIFMLIHWEEEKKNLFFSRRKVSSTAHFTFSR